MDGEGLAESDNSRNRTRERDVIARCLLSYGTARHGSNSKLNGTCTVCGRTVDLGFAAAGSH